MANIADYFDQRDGLSLQLMKQSQKEVPRARANKKQLRFVLNSYDFGQHDSKVQESQFGDVCVIGSKKRQIEGLKELKKEKKTKEANSMFNNEVLQQNSSMISKAGFVGSNDSQYTEHDESDNYQEEFTSQGAKAFSNSKGAVLS